jgi:hypothetical protein
VIDLKRLEATNTLGGVARQYKLELALLQEHLNEAYETLGTKLDHALQRRHPDQWGEEEAERLLKEWTAEAKQLVADSQARARELVARSTEAAATERVK